ncbi:MAG: ATP-binding protein, partial [Rudaea sp.]
DILRELVAVGSQQLAEEPELIGLDRFVGDCVERFRLLRPAVELSVDIDGVDAARPLRIVPGLRHAVINLLNNAADASASMHNARVHLKASHSGKTIDIEVRDFGPGLPSALRETAGRRFVTAKRDGLGLGLALADATAERLGGTLHVTGADGGGTRTSLLLPLPSLEHP